MVFKALRQLGNRVVIPFHFYAVFASKVEIFVVCHLFSYSELKTNAPNQSLQRIAHNAADTSVVAGLGYR
jgi:hypothetical protein